MPEPSASDAPPAVVASTPPRRVPARLRTALKFLPVLLLVGGVGYVRLIKPVDVATHRVERAELTTEVFGRGTVESRREARLGFDMPGRISDIRVDEGDRVKLGQELAHLAPEQYDADLRTAASGANLAKAAMARLDAEERRASATVAFAEAEEQRARTLSESGSVSPRDLDLSVQQLALAKAEFARVRASRGEAARSIEVAAGSVQQRRAVSMRTALVSPFDGVVVRRAHDPGDAVAVGATVLRVIATDRLWVRAWFDEAALGQLRDGQSAEVTFPGEPGKSFSGKVDRIGREADRQTHELLVDISIDTLPERLAIGQRADVRIALSKDPAVVQIPMGAVQRERHETYCYVDRGGRIARVPVSVGRSGRATVEVTSGLTEGDLVLTATQAGSALPSNRRWRTAAP